MPNSAVVVTRQSRKEGRDLRHELAIVRAASGRDHFLRARRESRHAGRDGGGGERCRGGDQVFDAEARGEKALDKLRCHIVRGRGFGRLRFVIFVAQEANRAADD